ncbi:MAG: hypothetical protein AAGJ35_13995, partial [Myxococcota bacterium]
TGNGSNVPNYVIGNSHKKSAVNDRFGREADVRCRWIELRFCQQTWLKSLDPQSACVIPKL